MASTALLLLALATAAPAGESPASLHNSSTARALAQAGTGAVHAASLLLASAPAPGTPQGKARAEARAPASAPAGATAEASGAADAHFARGVEALKKKDAAEAVRALGACVKQAPARVDCHWELGWAYTLEGRWTDALAEWTQVQQLAPAHPELAEALGQARGQVELQQKLAVAPSGKRAPPPQEARVRLRAVGDVMLGTDYPEGYLPPGGAQSVLAGVMDLLRDADLTFFNMEGPLCDSGTTRKCRSSSNCYAFRTPTSYAAVLKEAGVDLASTANNHSGDFGEVCRRETEAALDKQGVKWSGPPGSVATVERNGVRVGMVAFHTAPSCNHLNNLPTARALVKAVAAEHDVVVVSFHGGAEGPKALHVPRGRELFLGEDRGDLRAFSRAVVDAGADLVLGHGPHVVRGMELYKGRLIAYSLGNFATYGRFNLRGPQGLGMILDVEVDGEGRFQAGRILSTKQEGQGLVVPDAQGGAARLVRELTEADFPEEGVRVAEDGTLSPRGAQPVSTGSP